MEADDICKMYLVTIFIGNLFLPIVTGQTKDTSNYTCTENNSTARFTDSFESYSARHYSSNCSVPQCSITSAHNQNCRLSSTPCFDYRTVNNTSYCAPGILCSLLESCDAVNNTCASVTSICIINSCCTPKRVCLPIFLTNFCPINATTVISQSMSISYELPMSIEFNNGTANGSQMMVAKRGPLNQGQLIVLQATLQGKLNENLTTRNITISISNADVITGGQCKITSVTTRQTSRRVRRQTPAVLRSNDTITIYQKNVGQDLKSLVNITGLINCQSICTTAQTQAVFNVVLSQLQFTISSIGDLFYSKPTLSPNNNTAATLLLPNVHPSININSLAHLQVNNQHTLYYQQIVEPFVNTSSYMALVDYQFEVPSIIFDHSSLIHIVSQTDNTIVFGFNDSQAFALAAAWPQTGFAMVVGAQCLSNEGHEVYLLNGFVYNRENLTVAANYSTSQMSNISTNLNVTIGRNNTYFNESAGVGDPKPFLSNVSYIDSAFFRDSPNYLNNIFYATLNETADLILDDELGGYYNSLSQLLLYDMADPTDFDDDDAYQELITDDNVTESETDLYDMPLDPSDEQNATETDEDILNENMTIPFEDFDTADASFSSELINRVNALLNRNRSQSPTGRRRRRRDSAIHLRIVIWKPEQRLLVKPRLWGLIKDLLKPATKVFKAVVAVIDKVADTVQEVAKVVKVAVFGGEYEKRGRVHIRAGFEQPYVFYQGGGLKITCQECNVKGTIDIYGRFSFTKEGIFPTMTYGFVEATGNMRASAIVGLYFEGERTWERKKQIAAVPVTPLTIPGIFTLGPQIALDIGVRAQVFGSVTSTVGAYINWDRIYTKINLKSTDDSQCNGWVPRIEPVFTLDASARVEAAILIEPKIELALDVLNGKFKIATGFSAQGSLGASAQVQYTNDEAAECSTGVELGAFLGVDVRVYAQAGLGSNPWSADHSIYKEQFPAIDKRCLTFEVSESQVDENHNMNASSETRQKRQAPLSSTTSTTPATTPKDFTSAPVVNVSNLFFPTILANFQLALETDSSIVVVVGNDHNLYLSSRNSTNTNATTFNMVDILNGNDSSFLIQEKNNGRYVHSYGEIQDDAYARLRTHLETYMPYDSNVVFWSYYQGYLQFNRGGDWLYDIAGCLNSTIGTVRLWLVNGQDGLVALQDEYENCGLARLVFINFN